MKKEHPKMRLVKRRAQPRLLRVVLRLGLTRQCTDFIILKQVSRYLPSKLKMMVRFKNAQTHRRVKTMKISNMIKMFVMPCISSQTEPLFSNLSHFILSNVYFSFNSSLRVYTGCPITKVLKTKASNSVILHPICMKL